MLAPLATFSMFLSHGMFFRLSRRSTLSEGGTVGGGRDINGGDWSSEVAGLSEETIAGVADVGAPGASMELSSMIVCSGH